MYATIGKSKFAYKMPNHKPPKGFKQPNLPKYNMVTGDPNDHIHGFEKQLILNDNDLLKCKLFPMTLNGEAIRWFSKLLNYSIIFC